MGRKEPEEDQFVTNRELIREIHSKVTRMHFVLMGDNESGTKGVVHDVNDLKESDKKRAGMYTLIAALSSGMAIGLKAFYDSIMHK